ncbi:MAG: exodeoxyribonuclease VII small subunit [Proteobacteria bacterium]|nr:exodeoxyribonuclease VII small subunit [Pseudomonadota bacterium]
MPRAPARPPVPPAAAAAEPFDFERAMADLEGVVAQLEQGEVPLEEALKAFERGVALTRACQEALTAAEQKVEVLLTRPDGSATTVPLAPAGHDADGDA